MLYLIPIESYDHRYSEQWNRWFPDYLKSAQISHRIIWGKAKVASLNEHDVLDVYGTHQYKYSQLSQLVTLLKKGTIKPHDVLFFHTLWFTGLDSLQYIRQSLGVEFKLVGVLHAGSYDPWDFRTRLGMKPWSLHLERAWLTFVDRIFVASEFHRRLLLEHIELNPNKILVTRLPLKVDEIQKNRQNVPKENIVAFPHRLVPEKDPGLVDRLRTRLPGVEIVRTRDVCKTKEDYYDLLTRCKICISNAYQETFGYAMLESVALGCVPLVPERLCYPEMYPKEFLFQDEAQLAAKIKYFLEDWSDPRPQMWSLLNECDQAVEAMVNLALEHADEPMEVNTD